jgi:hypothetical protein
MPTRMSSGPSISRIGEMSEEGCPSRMSITSEWPVTRQQRPGMSLNSGMFVQDRSREELRANSYRSATIGSTRMAGREHITLSVRPIHFLFTILALDG